MPCCVLRFLVFRLAPSPVLFDIAAHRPGFASALGHPAGTVLRFLVFRPAPSPVLFDIAAHRRGSWLYACRRSPVGTSSSPPHLLPVSHSLSARRPPPSPICVLRFLVFRPAPSPVSPNIAAHRWGFASALGYPAGTVLRFRGIRSEIGLKKPDIAAHRPRRDAAWMEAQVLGADAGARVRGVWRRVEALGSGT